ncbi:MAG: efflux RND transporter periplasmic adaptor subunit [Planctomycetota bacterium]
MNRRAWIGSVVLLVAVGATGAGLAMWKRRAMEANQAAAANQPEPMEAVTAAVAREREFRRTTTAIGTVMALRSVTLRNEISGTVRKVSLTPGQIVEADTVLVALDVAVEEAELKALEAEAVLAETMLTRMDRASQGGGASAVDVERARSVRDVALAQTARTKAIIARKTIRAPFRARIGLSDVHPGQYLAEGTQLTTLQGVDDGVHVDFAVPQRVAAELREGETVQIFAARDALAAKIVAIDSRVDPSTRNATVRVRVDGVGRASASGASLVPGASVRAVVPVGAARNVVVVPVNALRKGPSGDHVYVLADDSEGKLRAQLRNVQSGPMLGDDVVIYSGIALGDRVATAGSFKLREGVLVAVVGGEAPSGETKTAP